MVYRLSISSSKAISIGLNKLYNVNKNQLELLYQRVKGRVNSASAVSVSILLTKRLQQLPGNAAQSVIRDQLLNPGDLYNL